MPRPRAGPAAAPCCSEPRAPRRARDSARAHHRFVQQQFGDHLVALLPDAQAGAPAGQQGAEQLQAGSDASARGEIEITDLNRIYLEMSELQVIPFSRGVAWLDAGTHESLLQAANFVQAVEDRQGLMISSPEEIAYRQGFINRDQLHTLAKKMGNNGYANYLLRLANEG